MPGGHISSDEGLHAALTQQIIDAAFRVHKSLGNGFLEKVYENALAIELMECGLEVVQQAPIEVHYHGHTVGNFLADLLVNGCVIVEIKAVDGLVIVHEVQLVNYLRATPIEVGLLINFGQRLAVKRRILTNDRKLRP
jgi:GxxExxY protein